MTETSVHDMDALASIAEDDCLYVEADDGSDFGKVDVSVLRSELLKQRGGANLQTGTTYTLVLSDAGKVVELANASPITLTIPANASVAFPVNTVIYVVQGGAGAVTINITSDTLNGTTSLSTQWDSVTLWKRAATEWIASSGITSSGSDASAIHDDESGEIAAINEKTTIVPGDILLLEDSEASNDKKRATVENAVDARVVAVASGKKSVWIPVQQMYEGGFRQPGAEVAVGSSGSTGQLRGVPFDPNSVEVMMLDFAIPASMDVASGFSYTLYWSPATTNTGVVSWYMKAIAYADGDAIDQTRGTSTFVEDTANGTVGDMHITAESTELTIKGAPAAGQPVSLEVTRNADSGTDTFTGDAYLHGVMLHYTTDAPTDD